MVVFPNAKINLGLQVVSRRQDGYHHIDSLFYPIGFCDVLEILPCKQGENFSFQQLGEELDCEQETNLVVRAYRLLEKEYALPPIRLILKKNIPTGAGLGGGSADASFTLRGINEMFSLGLNQTRLEKYALKLGADCPFFINNSPCLVSGVGEVLHPIDFSLKGYFMVLLKPDIHVSTAEAYSRIIAQKPALSIAEIIKYPVEQWKTRLKNDFEASVIPNHPVIQTLKDDLYKQGAVYASMSGSGAAVYGLFEQEQTQDFRHHIWSGWLQ